MKKFYPIMVIVWEIGLIVGCTQQPLHKAKKYELRHFITMIPPVHSATADVEIVAQWQDAFYVPIDRNEGQVSDIIYWNQDPPLAHSTWHPDSLYQEESGIFQISFSCQDCYEDKYPGHRIFYFDYNNDDHWITFRANGLGETVSPLLSISPYTVLSYDSEENELFVRWMDRNEVEHGRLPVSTVCEYAADLSQPIKYTADAFHYYFVKDTGTAAGRFVYMVNSKQPMYWTKSGSSTIDLTTFRVTENTADSIDAITLIFSEEITSPGSCRIASVQENLDAMAFDFRSELHEDLKIAYIGSVFSLSEENIYLSLVSGIWTLPRNSSQFFSAKNMEATTAIAGSADGKEIWLTVLGTGCVDTDLCGIRRPSTYDGCKDRTCLYQLSLSEVIDYSMIVTAEYDRTRLLDPLWEAIEVRGRTSKIENLFK